MLDGDVHLMFEPCHTRLAGGIMVPDIAVHTLPGKCALSVTRPEDVVHVTAVNRHPMTLLHPPGEEVSNHGTPVPTLIAAKEEETIAWRAPLSSGSVGKLSQGFHNACRNVSETAVMHVDQTICRMPPHVSSEVGVVSGIFQWAEVYNLNISRPKASFQDMPGSLVLFPVIEPRYTAWQNLGSCSMILFYMSHAHRTYGEPPWCCRWRCHAAVCHLGTAWQPEMADRQRRWERIPRESARTL